MKSLPNGVDAAVLRSAMADHWGRSLNTLEFAPVGFGSYHWAATTTVGERLFLSVDDLDQKAAWGRTRDLAYNALDTAFHVTVRLAREDRLEFVVAPIVTT